MKWIQIGTAKSGNYWIYQILQSIAMHARLERRSFIKNHPIHAIAKTWNMAFPHQQEIDHLSIHPKGYRFNIGNIFNMPIDDIDDYIKQTSHVWMHTPCCKKTQETLRLFDKKIYIIRDPRDIAVSLSRYVFTPYRQKFFPSDYRSPESYLQDRLAEIVRGWVHHVGNYLKCKKELDIYVFFYERFLFQFDEELKMLLSYLGIHLDDAARSKIKDEVSFKTLSQHTSQHLRKGIWGDWTEKLKNSQIKLVNDIAGGMLKYLCYPTSRKMKISAPSLPRLPDHLCHEELDKMMRRASRQFKMLRAKEFLKKIGTKLIPELVGI